MHFNISQIPTYQECIMPQQICQKCCNQLKSSYKFIKQACQALQQHLQMVYDQQTSSDDVKNIEDLQESVIEITEAVYSTKCDDDMKLEPFVIEKCGIKIKQELQDSEILIEENFPKRESLEEK